MTHATGDGQPDVLASIPDDEATAVLGAPARTALALGHSRFGSTRGVWRVVAPDGRRAVLKVVGPREDERAERTRRPSSYLFWAREPIVFDEGLPAAYRDAGIRGPRLLRRVDRPDGAVALWLEDVEGRTGAELSVADLGAFARRLGEAQGRIAVAGAPQPTWASRGFLREYGAERPVEPGSAGRLELDDPRWQRPAMGVIDPALRDALIRLQRERPTFVGWVEAAPRTLAHLDAWPTNVFVTPTRETVLIDWAYAGEGALGEDIGNLVPDAVFDLLHPATVLPDLDRVAFDGYLAGLRAAGWDGDERVVRLATCASAVKYDWIAAAMLARSDADEQRSYGTAPPVTTAELFAARSAVMRFLAGWADEARRLAAELGRA
jgi:hypothetical protein